MVLTLVAFAGHAFGQKSVLLTPWVERALYCRQSDGGSVFQLVAGITYTNVSARPVIVPLFAVVSGYRVEKRDGAKVLKSKANFTEMDVVSPDAWSGSTPNPELFRVLQPGQVLRTGSRTEVLRVSDGTADTKSAVYPAGQYSVYLEMDHGTRTAKLPILRAGPKSDDC